jgi:hypothetical protein
MEFVIMVSVVDVDGDSVCGFLMGKSIDNGFA